MNCRRGSPTQIQKAIGAIESQYAEAQEKENELEAEMQRQRQETLNLNDAVAQYAILQRDVDTNRELYNAIMTRMKDVAVSGDIQIDQCFGDQFGGSARRGPSSPKKVRALMLALIGGLGIGIALAFTMEFLDNTLKNPEEAENYLRLPNLGVVPEFSSVNGKTAYAPRQLMNGARLDGSAAGTRTGNHAWIVFASGRGLSQPAHRPAAVARGRTTEGHADHQRDEPRGQDGYRGEYRCDAGAIGRPGPADRCRLAPRAMPSRAGSG